MDCSVKTKPGYQVFSPSFVAVFIGGNREELEERKNWHDMMKELLNAFEKWPRDMSEVAWEAGTTWIWNSILYHGIKDIRIKISNNKFSRKPGDRIKAVVHVLLGDYNGIQSMLTFEVKKKQEMKKLQTLSAETVSDFVSKKEDFEHLEVPDELLTNLNEAYDDIWRGKMKCQKCKDKLERTYFVQCPSNITHKFCFPCARNYIINYSSSEVFCPSGE